MLQITEVQGKILLALSKYKFLTASQLHRLNIAKDISYIRTQLKNMSESSKNAYIGKMVFGIHASIGRLENVYYLTKRAKEILIEDFGLQEHEIKYPIGTRLYDKDYFHRKNTIDFQIRLQEWISKTECVVDFFDTYYDKIGNNRRDGTSESKTKILLKDENFLLADGIFQISTPGNKYLFLFEMYNGRDTKRVIAQLHKHVQAIELGTPSLKYKFPKGHRVIAIFEFETAKKAVIQRAEEDSIFQNMYQRFLFKSLDEIKLVDFFENWHLMLGENCTLIPNLD
jgi:hypothetical protein